MAFQGDWQNAKACSATVEGAKFGCAVSSCAMLCCAVLCCATRWRAMKHSYTQKLMMLVLTRRLEELLHVEPVQSKSTGRLLIMKGHDFLQGPIRP